MHKADCCISIFPGATPYTRVLETVRSIRGRIGDPTSSAAAATEQQCNFYPYDATDGPSSSKSWTIKVVCLHDKDANKVP